VGTSFGRLALANSNTLRGVPSGSSKGWTPVAAMMRTSMAAVPGQQTQPTCRERVLVVLLRVARIIVGMTVTEILAQLKSLGDDARRVHNTKAGAPDNQFGVKLGDIRAMAKKIKTDHELALNLWDTRNVEAQLLATLIIKPALLSGALR
jgi:hypothetical protein